MENNSLLIDKWFSIQAIFTPASNILQTIERLSLHPDFNYKNPNRFRSLIGSFAFNNHKAFHSKDGSGYEIVSKWIKKMDKINPWHLIHLQHRQLLNLAFFQMILVIDQLTHILRLH